MKISLKTIAITGLAVLATISASAYKTHKVERNETLWGVSYKYGVSVDDIIKLNPAAKNGVSAGMTLLIPEAVDVITQMPDAKPSQAQQQPVNSASATADKPQTVQESMPEVLAAMLPTDKTYVSRKGDTFASISKQTKVSVKDLRRLNPFVDGELMPEGTIVRLTDDAFPGGENARLSVVDSIFYKLMKHTPAQEQAREKTQTVVVALPFNASAATINGDNLLATEFYKGLLLSINDNSPSFENPPFKLVALDTHGSLENLQKNLKALDPEEISLIIPGDDEAKLDALQKYAADNNIMLLNVLSIKDNAYTSNPNVVQCNINQKLMYNKAISTLTSDFAGYTPVILVPEGAPTEKSAFVDALKLKYKELGQQVLTISFKKQLSSKDLATLKTGGKYVFIPLSGSTEAFERFAPALGEYILNNPQNAKLFGYPDYVAYLGKNLEALHNMGVTIYSRFFMDRNDTFTKKVLDDFAHWYGKPMLDVFPVQGMLGYDVGNLLVRMLRKKWIDETIGKFDGAAYNGEQSSFHFITEPEAKGLINDALYIIEFLPGGTFLVRVI